jgi:hypothetical protein
MATVGKVDSLTLTIIALTVGADLTATPTVPFTYSYSPPLSNSMVVLFTPHWHRQAPGATGRPFTVSGFARVGLSQVPRVRKIALPGV